MKHINRIFSVGLASLSLSPLFMNFANTNANIEKTLVVHSNPNRTVEEKDMRCTVAYVGKNCSQNGLAIIARSNDARPRGSNSYVKRVEHNQLANTTIKNDFGFEYKMPSETYAYISTPDSWKTNPKEDKRFLWEAMGINEMGVGVTCTLTCSTNQKAQDLEPFVDSGIAEETFNQIIAAQADSARKAMEIVADCVDKHGNQDANLIMVTDQKETWLMELYTGHQYCAVKLPDDKAMVAGNEFILDSLHDLGINESNKDEMCITSPNLLGLVKDQPWVKYIEGTSESEKDIFHLDLFHTYAGDEDQGKMVDGCHMRTWRGYSLWQPNGAIAKAYGAQTKYPPLFEPNRKLSVYDVASLFRDEYDELIGESGFEEFTKAKEEGTLRSIATETARLVHIITSDPSLPKEIACNALYCPSSANYTPFIQLNNGINYFNDEFSYEPQRWVYDEQCASVLYRRLNSIAWPHREKYGYPLQQFWSIFEYIYITQMQQVIEDASKLPSMSNTRSIISNFNKHEREIYLDTVKNVTKDLFWHDMNQDHRKEESILKFEPLVDIEQYLSVLGWKDFNRNENIITFKYTDDTEGKLDIGDGYWSERGKLYIDDLLTNIDVTVRDNKIFVGLDTLNTAIGSKHKLVKIDINDYLDKISNINVAIALPLAICLPIAVAGGVVIPIIIKRRKGK